MHLRQPFGHLRHFQPARLGRVPVGALDLDLPGLSEEAFAALNLRAARETVDRRAIHQALTRTDSNISATAKLLGISRPTT